MFTPLTQTSRFWLCVVARSEMSVKGLVDCKVIPSVLNPQVARDFGLRRLRDSTPRPAFHAESCQRQFVLIERLRMIVIEVSPYSAQNEEVSRSRRARLRRQWEFACHHQRP